MKPGQAFEQSLLASLPRRKNPETGKLETNPLIFSRKSPTPPRPAPVRELVAECRMLRAAVEGASITINRALVARGNEILEAGLGATPSPAWALSLSAQRAALASLSTEPEWIAKAEKYGSSFTAGAGVDITITAPAQGPRRVDGGPQPSWLVYDALGRAECRPGCPVVHFDIEAKSVAVPRLDHSDLRDEQARILRQARAACHVAGIAIEFRGEEFSRPAPRECWFVLIDAWDAQVASAVRKSLSLDWAREIGVRIERDEERGKTAVYWRMGEFLAHFGAEV